MSSIGLIEASVMLDSVVETVVPWARVLCSSRRRPALVCAVFRHINSRHIFRQGECHAKVHVSIQADAGDCKVDYFVRIPPSSSFDPIISGVTSSKNSSSDMTRRVLVPRSLFSCDFSP